MNYFNYFTEIETRFQQRRGSLLMLSTLDWALIETWREAGVPLEAVLRGIDAAFDNRDSRPPLRGNRRQRKINGLAWCCRLSSKQSSSPKRPPSAPRSPPPPNPANPVSGRPVSAASSNATPRSSLRQPPIFPCPRPPPPPNPPLASLSSPPLCCHPAA